MLKIDTLRFLDWLYHKSHRVLPLKWACNRYDKMLIAGAPDSYALRCPVCEGIQYPGLSHNKAAPDCVENTDHGG